jgi:LysR family transcriptional regulator, nod-box dependent transcriptional activator
MRFKGLDLNLLVTLDVLLELRSVSRAAERLHLSQPAVSAALARLRDFFNDPLLESQGKRMVPTPKALQLQPALAELLSNVDRMIVQGRQFDPSTSTQWFRICISDYLSTVLFPRLIHLLQAQGPSIRLDLQTPSDLALSLLEQGEIDVLLVPKEHCLRDHPAELLFEERYVIAGWAGNPLLAGALTEEDFYAAPHVAVAIGASVEERASFAEDELNARGRERQIEIMASSFTQVPSLLIGTQRLTLMQERLARTLATTLPIAWQPLPFEFPLMREMIQYHRSRGSDPALGWLVARIREAALA